MTGHEADHSPSPAAEVKNEWSYTSLPPMPSYIAQRKLYFSNDDLLVS